MKRIVMLLALGAFAACGETDTDASAQNACEHFHNVAGDADLLSDGELRGKLQEVHDMASSTDDTSVSSAAREMLATYTQTGESVLFNSAVTDMSDACDPYRG